MSGNRYAWSALGSFVSTMSIMILESLKHGRMATTHDLYPGAILYIIISCMHLNHTKPWKKKKKDKTTIPIRPPLQP